MEIWKDIDGFNNIYQISNYGRVRSLDRILRNGNKIKGKILKVAYDKDGYEKLCLKHNEQRYYARVHRLVAIAFIENKDNYELINHKDGNRSNNHVDNLHWCDASYNQWHRCHVNNNKPDNTYKKLPICAIMPDKTILSFNSITECAEYFNVSRVCISRKLNGKSNNPSFNTHKKEKQLYGITFIFQ